MSRVAGCSSSGRMVEKREREEGDLDLQTSSTASLPPPVVVLVLVSGPPLLLLLLSLLAHTHTRILPTLRLFSRSLSSRNVFPLSRVPSWSSHSVAGSKSEAMSSWCSRSSHSSSKGGEGRESARRGKKAKEIRFEGRERTANGWWCGCCCCCWRMPRLQAALLTLSPHELQQQRRRPLSRAACPVHSLTHTHTRSSSSPHQSSTGNGKRERQQELHAASAALILSSTAAVVAAPAAAVAAVVAQPGSLAVVPLSRLGSSLAARHLSSHSLTSFCLTLGVCLSCSSLLASSPIIVVVVRHQHRLSSSPVVSLAILTGNPRHNSPDVIVVDNR